MANHECCFVEEREPGGRLIVSPCIVCGKSAMDGLEEVKRLRALCVEVAQCKHRAVGIGGQMCGAGTLRVDMSEALFGRIAAAGREEGQG